ncbi:TPA: hypothetical protein U1151_001312 [Streptococcus suis]|nr:hypothetical protein [Streptococcus suis]
MFRPIAAISFNICLSHAFPPHQQNRSSNPKGHGWKKHQHQIKPNWNSHDHIYHTANNHKEIGR